MILGYGRVSLRKFDMSLIKFLFQNVQKLSLSQLGGLVYDQLLEFNDLLSR